MSSRTLSNLFDVFGSIDSVPYTEERWGTEAPEGRMSRKVAMKRLTCGEILVTSHGWGPQVYACVETLPVALKTAWDYPENLVARQGYLVVDNVHCRFRPYTLTAAGVGVNTLTAGGGPV